MNPILLSPVANHLWQSTLFAAAAWLLTLALRKNYARVRHGVWLAASCKFLIPVSVLVALGGQVRWRTAPEVTASVLYVAVDHVGRPFSASAISRSSLSPVPDAAIPFTDILFCIWACGFVGIAISWWVRWKRIGAAVREGSPLLPGVPVPAVYSATSIEPGVFGVFRPILLVPEGICDRLTPAQLEAVIVHELCHVRHRDNLVAAFHMFVETVFWFHPVVWWIGKQMVAEREQACDEEVVCGGSEPRVYAEGILNVCRLYVESPLVCVSGVTGSNLKRRIEAIMAGRGVLRLSFAKKAALAITAVAASIVPIVIGLLDAPAGRAQSAGARVPRFAVASIKPCKDEPGRMRGGGDSTPGRLSVGCDVLVGPDQPLGLIQRAYVRFAGGHTNPFGIVPIRGGPPWIHSDLYEINARAEGNPSLEMMQGPMLQALLEDRFKLRTHRETIQGPVYALIVAKGGPKLKPFQEGSCVQMPLTIPASTPGPGQRFCKDLIALRKPAVDAEGSTVAEFSKLLNLILDRPVIDRTGLTKRFDIHLEFARDEAAPGLHGIAPGAPEPGITEPTGPSIFTAIQEQLGLKLEPTRGPSEILVIDHIERPSEN